MNNTNQPITWPDNSKLPHAERVAGILAVAARSKKHPLPERAPKEMKAVV